MANSKQKTRKTGNAIMKAAKETYIKEDTLVWNDVKIGVKTFLPFEDAYKLSVGVITAVFSGDAVTYTPEAEEFAIRTGVMQYYTDAELPQDMDELYELLFCTDLYKCVLPMINQDQLDSVLTAIHKRIASMLDAHADLAGRQIADMSKTLGDLVSSSKKLLEGVDDEDVRKLVGAIADGGLDEEKLVQAFLKENK